MVKQQGKNVDAFRRDYTGTSNVTVFSRAVDLVGCIADGEARQVFMF